MAPLCKERVADGLSLCPVLWKAGTPLPPSACTADLREGFESLPRENSASPYSSLPCPTTRVRLRLQPRSEFREEPVSAPGPTSHKPRSEPSLLLPPPSLCPFRPRPSAQFKPPAAPTPNGRRLLEASPSSLGSKPVKARKPSYSPLPVGACG